MRGTFQGQKSRADRYKNGDNYNNEGTQIFTSLQIMFHKLYEVLKWCFCTDKNGQGMIVIQYDEKVLGVN